MGPSRKHLQNSVQTLCIRKVAATIIYGKYISIKRTADVDSKAGLYLCNNELSDTAYMCIVHCCTVLVWTDIVDTNLAALYRTNLAALYRTNFDQLPVISLSRLPYCAMHNTTLTLGVTERCHLAKACTCLSRVLVRPWNLL